MSFNEFPKIVVKPPGPKAKELIEREKKVISSGLGVKLFPVVPERGYGALIEDVDGNVFIDFLAGAAAAASFAEMGYVVKNFCYQDSPRRAHSIAAQGGINAAKNYPNDGDSIYRLFYDTVKGGDYRSREANVYRLAEVSNNIIDQCVAQGVPFAREYSGNLSNRSFGGALVSRTFYARGQTGQQLLLGAYSGLSRQIGKGNVEMHNRTELMDIVVIDGKARGIVTRNMITGEIESHFGHAVVLATGGYGNVFFLSTNAMGSNGSAAWKAYKKGAFMANPCFVQIHPTAIPQHGDFQSKLTLMSESLRNDGRIWVPKNIEDVEKVRKGEIKPKDIKELILNISRKLVDHGVEFKVLLWPKVVEIRFDLDYFISVYEGEVKIAGFISSEEKPLSYIFDILKNYGKIVFLKPLK